MNALRTFSVGSLFALAALAVAGSPTWGTGTLAVIRMGDGITSLSAATAPVSLVEFDRLTGTATNAQVDLTFNGTAGITLTGNTTGEGGMNVTQDVATLGGYPLAPGFTGATTSLGRRVIQVNLNGSGSLGAAQDLAIAAGQIRDAVLFSGVNFAISTASQGIQVGTFGSSVTTSGSAETNTRYLSRTVWDGSVGYSTTAAGNYWVKEINTDVIWLDAIAAGIIVADFAIANDGLTMYLASDAATTSTGGVWRFTRTDTSVPFAGLTGIRIYSTSATRHITLYESGGQHQVFATHRSGATSSIYGFLNAANLPSASAASWTASAPANTVYLGISAIPVPPVRISGTVQLQNYVGSPGRPLLELSLRSVGGSTTVAAVPVTLSNTGSFSRTLPESVTPGTYDVYLDGSPWLRRKLGSVTLASGSNTANFTLINGDVDDSGEVDAADIDSVIAHFGETPDSPSWLESADVDGSEEVDAADIDIVIASFGNVDE